MATALRNLFSIRRNVLPVPHTLIYHNAFLTGVWGYYITDNTMFRPKILLKHVNMINIATLHM